MNIHLCIHTDVKIVYLQHIFAVPIVIGMFLITIIDVLLELVVDYSCGEEKNISTGRSP